MPRVKTGDLVRASAGGVVGELRAVNEGQRTETEVMARIFELEALCRQAYPAAPLPEAPDVCAIEAFVLRCYLGG